MLLLDDDVWGGMVLKPVMDNHKPTLLTYLSSPKGFPRPVPLASNGGTRVIGLKPPQQLNPCIPNLRTIIRMACHITTFAVGCGRLIFEVSDCKRKLGPRLGNDVDRHDPLQSRGMPNGPLEKSGPLSTL